MRVNVVMISFIAFFIQLAFAQPMDPVSGGVNKPCNGIPLDISAMARSFMDRHGLILEGEEQQFSSGTAFKWALYDTTEVKRPDSCLLIMNVCYQGKENLSCDSTDIFEVLVYRKNEVRLFEDVYDIPTKIYAKFGNRLGAENPYDFYFAELSGPSVLAVKKAEYAKMFWSRERYRNGFSGLVINDGKIAYDPTPGRSWRVVNSSFSLRLEHINEVHDVYPHDFDNDFELMLEGCLKNEFFGSVGCEAQPWNGSFNSILAEFDE